ncbi:unnamed protein product [Calypogeia fissa]
MGRDWSLEAVELESGPGYQCRLWKWACYFASEKIGGSADESKYEAAIFAAQCGNVERMLPVCYTWEVCKLEEILPALASQLRRTMAPKWMVDSLWRSGNKGMVWPRFYQ